MPHYQYLIIGGGMTGAAAARRVREIDARASVGMFSAETDPPYKRPPLTKGLWTGKTKLDSIWYQTEDLERHLGRTIQSIDPSQKRAVDDQRADYTYDKLLIATGGRPRRLPFGGDAINYFRTVQDYHRLRRDTDQASRFAVIGGGFIGSELAAALAMNAKEVVMLFPSEGISANVFPHELSQWINDYYRNKGVEILTDTTVTGVEARGEQFAVMAKNKDGQRHEFMVDRVVAGLGIEANVELAQNAGLTVENGIVVDEFLSTSHPDVFAAGDVASFHNPALGKRLRVEHEDNANVMGTTAGKNMAGQPTPYHHLPFFYSDLFELGYEAVGELDSRLETFSDWKEPFKEGVVYYLRDQRVRGVLLWNVWEQVDAARRLIAEEGPFTSENLKGRLPER